MKTQMFNSVQDIPSDFTGCASIGKTRRYYMNGILHKTDGPAVINIIGERWFSNGLLHRTDGPAEVIYHENTVKFNFYVNGIQYKEKDFKKKFSW